jgi:hypothetical protein
MTSNKTIEHSSARDQADDGWLQVTPVGSRQAAEHPVKTGLLIGADG